MTSPPVVAVDVGGTKIRAGSVIDGVVDHLREVPTPAAAGARAILGTIAEVARGVIRDTEVSTPDASTPTWRIGIGFRRGHRSGHGNRRLGHRLDNRLGGDSVDRRDHGASRGRNASCQRCPCPCSRGGSCRCRLRNPELTARGRGYGHRGRIHHGEPPAHGPPCSGGAHRSPAGRRRTGTALPLWRHGTSGSDRLRARGALGLPPSSWGPRSRWAAGVDDT